MTTPMGQDEWEELGDRQAELAGDLARREAAAVELADSGTGVR